MRTIFLSLFSGLFLFVLSCSETPRGTNNHPSPLPVNRDLPTISLRIGGREATVEVAATPETRTIGLMNRDSMPENHGMLFVFETPQYHRFWMKDTRIPLDIAFIRADGSIAQISQMQPFDLSSTVSRFRTPYALEMNQGWFERNGIREGGFVDLSALEDLP